MKRSATDGLAVLTGGAGFIATNVADRLLGDGWRVRLFDNLSRAGVDQNVAWLRAKHGDRVEFVYADVRDGAMLRRTLAGGGGIGRRLRALVAIPLGGPRPGNGG